MSRILALIAAASLLSLAACQSAPEQTAQAEEKPAAEKTAAPAEAVPAAEPTPAAEPAKSVSVPVKVEVSQPAPQPMPAPAPKVAKPKAAVRTAAISQEEAMALARKGNCLTCHKIEKKVVGPAWKDVAAKYRGKPDAAATIAANIKKGGSFGWKFGKMPPRGGSKLSDADVAKLAGFIAGLK